MAANYSTNPTNPVNQNGGALQAGSDQQPQPQQQVQQSPKSIRDYLSVARSTGATPTFTNRPEFQGQGFLIDDRSQAAIPEGPQSDYESQPFMDRIKQDPYQRAQARLQTMLPDLWNQVFPGMEQGAILDQKQMNHWQKAVGALTSNLLKQYDKQLEWFRKNEQEQSKRSATDRRFWQSKFVDAQLRGTPVLKEDGTPMSEVDFVKERINNASEMQFKEDASKQAMAGVEGDTDLDPKTVTEIMNRNPQLAIKIRSQAKVFIEDGLGRNISDSELQGLMKDPNARNLIQESVRDAVEYYRDEINEIRGIPSGMNMSD